METFDAVMATDYTNNTCPVCQSARLPGILASMRHLGLAHGEEAKASCSQDVIKMMGSVIELCRPSFCFVALVCFSHNEQSFRGNWLVYRLQRVCH